MIETGHKNHFSSLEGRGILRGPHPFPPIAPATTGARGGNGRATGVRVVRAAEKGAPQAYGWCAARGGTEFESRPRPRPFPPIAPVRTGAPGGKRRATGARVVRPAEKGAQQAHEWCARWKRVRHNRICGALRVEGLNRISPAPVLADRPRKNGRARRKTARHRRTSGARGGKECANLGTGGGVRVE